MFVSKWSIPSLSLTVVITLFVTGRIIISYATFAITCVAISDIIPVSPMLQNMIGTNITESDNSPATDDTIARSEKRLPWSATFMRLMMAALMVDPARNASSDAMAARGVAPSTVSNASLPSQNGDGGSMITSCDISTKKKFMANPVQMTIMALRYP